MLLTIGQKKIQDRILKCRENALWFYGVLNGVRLLHASEIARIVSDQWASQSEYRISKEWYMKFIDLEAFCESQRGYFFQEDIEDEKMKKGLTSMNFEKLLAQINSSSRYEWEQKSLFYLAVFEVFNTMFQDLGIPIGEAYLT